MPKPSSDRPLDFTMMISSHNVGMRTRADVAQVLEDAARMLREFSCTPRVLTSGVRDVNGNTVGHWRLTNAVEEEDRDAE